MITEGVIVVFIDIVGVNKETEGVLAEDVAILDEALRVFEMVVGVPEEIVGSLKIVRYLWRMQ